MEIVKEFRLSQMGNNCYLIKTNNKHILIDAPDEISKVINFLKNNKEILDAVYVTHIHFDHILGLEELKKEYPKLKIYVSDIEKELINDKKYNLCNYAGISKLNIPNDIVSIKEINDDNLKFIHISGHTRDSICYYFKKEKILFSGDTLFANSIGRSDLIDGDEELIKKHIKNRILEQLDDDVVVYPGHGYSTIISSEKENNVFLKG